MKYYSIGEYVMSAVMK